MDIIESLKNRAKDEPFCKLLGFKIKEIGMGYARVEGVIDERMLNIHGITHGGALFALLDEAFELASNSHGTIAVALNMNVTFHSATTKGDILISEAKEIHKTKRTATYLISVKKEDGTLVASCQALVYRKGEKFKD